MTPDSTLYQIEQQRIRFRRLSLHQQAPGPSTPQRGNWGLALSGGGIRSATFNLGLLQSLAAASIPLLHISGDADDIVPIQENTLLLQQFA